MSFWDDANAEYDQTVGPTLNAGAQSGRRFQTRPVPMDGSTSGRGTIEPLPPGQSGDWISQALAQAETTDPEQMWRDYIAKDPKASAGDPSAIDYWKMRIAKGNGAKAVKEGRESLYGPPQGQQGPPMGMGDRGPSLAELGQLRQSMGVPAFRPMAHMQAPMNPMPMQQGPGYQPVQMQQGPAYQQVPMQGSPSLAQLGQMPFNYQIASRK